MRGRGVMEHIKSVDWEKNPLGGMEKWPHSLKISLNICLNSPFPMLICWGPQLIMLYNEGYTKFLDGFDAYGAIGKPAEEVWEEIWGDIGPMLHGVKRTGNSVYLEDQWVPLKRNGIPENRYFTFSYSAIADDTEIEGVLAIVHETTEKVLNERKLQMEQERMHRIFMQAPAAICILNGPNMVFEMVNPVYQQLFPGRELLGKELLKALPELNGTPIVDILMDVYHTGETFLGSELLVPLPGEEGAPLEDYFFDFVYQARMDGQKQIDGIVVFAYDVSEFVNSRKAAEQLAIKVEQQAKAFDVTLTAIQDMVYTFDVEGRFTYSNHPLLDLLGISLDQIIGKTFHELPYPAKLAQKLHMQINQVVVTGMPVTDETEFIGPQGRRGTFEYIFAPVLDNKGKVVLVAGSTREISERKKSEEAINTKNNELTHLNKELFKVNADLDNFIYTASHDLKAPIANIEGLVITLGDFFSRQNQAFPVVDKLLEMIKSSIIRFNHTIQDLSDITKLQRLNEEEEILIDLKEVVKGIELDLALLLEKSKGNIQVELDQVSRIKFSPKNLRSVMYNLISNSLKYRSPDRDPVITISGQEDQIYSIITVRDNGIGMDLSGKESIFGMFQRLHSHVEGTGIGLYIVKNIMDNAEGKIEVSSKEGLGTTFRLSFKKNIS